MSSTTGRSEKRVEEGHIAEPLDRDDQRIQAARAAEQAAYEQYGFDPSEHYIDVPELVVLRRETSDTAQTPELFCLKPLAERTDQDIRDRTVFA